MLYDSEIFPIDDEQDQINYALVWCRMFSSEGRHATFWLQAPHSLSECLRLARARGLVEQAWTKLTAAGELEYEARELDVLSALLTG